MIAFYNQPSGNSASLLSPRHTFHLPVKFQIPWRHSADCNWGHGCSLVSTHSEVATHPSRRGMHVSAHVWGSLLCACGCSRSWALFLRQNTDRCPLCLQIAGSCRAHCGTSVRGKGCTYKDPKKCRSWDLAKAGRIPEEREPEVSQVQGWGLGCFNGHLVPIWGDTESS